MSKIYRVFGEGDESELVVGEDLLKIKCACGGKLDEAAAEWQDHLLTRYTFVCQACHGKYEAKLEEY